ncbi:dienelactone hydrolase family protein [Sphingomonas sp. MMS24-JH45]
MLAVNQFHRSTKTPYTALPDARAQAMEWRKSLTPETTTRDALAFVTWLDAQKAVDEPADGLDRLLHGWSDDLPDRGCPARPRARHRLLPRGGLVGEAPQSPNRLVPQLRGNALIAIAQNDDARAPGDKDALRAAFAAVKRPAEIEVYPANHGWRPPDSPAYDKVQAERAWARQLVLLKTL